MGRLARQEATRLVSAYLKGHRNDPSATWLAVYRTVLWYDNIGGSLLPHIMEVNALAQGSWAKRARDVNDYIARSLGVRPSSVAGAVDKLMSLPAFAGKQRQNPLGEGFIGAILGVLSDAGAQGITYRAEAPSTDFFPGITIPGRSSIPKIDVVALKEDRLVAIISAKWSLRHDRLSDITNECPVYKEAAFRHWRVRPAYYVVTNEFMPARLQRLTSDACVDGVVHVHAPLVTQVCKLQAQVLDLTDLIQLTRSW